MAERIDREAFEEKVEKSVQPVVVDFYSDSCIACKKLSPSFCQAEAFFGDTISFYKVNTNYESTLVEKYGILSAPTMIVFLNGKEADRKTGAIEAQALIGWLKAFQ